MASPLILANNVASLLAANIGPSDTALLVTAGQGVRFPTPAGGTYFYATLIHIATGAVEVVRVTGRSVDTLTIVRGQDGTTPISFTTGSAVEMRVNAQIFREIDWRTSNNAPNLPVVLDGAGLITDAMIPAAITRDSELTAGLATKQNTLGYAPVQQGTGVGQLTNTVKVGWSAGSKVLVTIDAADQGAIAMENWVNGAFVTSVRGVANKLASLDGSGLVPVGQIPALGYLPLGGGTITGNLAVNGGHTVAGAILSNTLVQSTQNFSSVGTNVVLGCTGAGSVYLRPNGVGSATGEAVLASSGIFSGTNFNATSDIRLKKDVHTAIPRAFLADLMEWKAFRWIEDDRADVGVIAQHVKQHAPEHVYARPDGKLGVDKASLALEMVIGLSSRLRHLEAITNA